MTVALTPSGLTLGTTTVADWNSVGGGKVLQVVQTVDATQAFYNPATYNADFITATITPSATSSKILITLNAKLGSTEGNGGLSLRRNTTVIGANGSNVNGYPSGYGANSFVAADFCLNGLDDYINEDLVSMSDISHTYLDSPNTTSAITYRISADSARLVIKGWNRAAQASKGAGTSTLTLMEIAG